MHTLFYTLAVVTAVFLVSLTPPGKSFRRRMMARMYTKVQQKHEACVAERKRQLLSCLTGTVLEIGPGTGVNFKYMPDTVERWIGIEPNPHMHAELEAAGAKHDIETEFRILSIEGMGFCEVEMERFELPKVVASALISPHVAGSAVK